MTTTMIFVETKQYLISNELNEFNGGIGDVNVVGGNVHGSNN
jgi:hypothetical protein